MRRFRPLPRAARAGAVLLGSSLALFTALTACGDSDTDGLEADVDAAPTEVDGSFDGAAGNEDAATGDAAEPDAGDANDASDAGKLCSGQGWCHAYAPADQNLEAVWGDGAGTVWAVSREGNVLRYAGDAGGIARWTIVFTDRPGDGGAPRPLHAIWGSSATDIWVAGAGGLFHGRGLDSASLAWARVAVEGDVPVTSLWGTSATDVWAVGWSPSTRKSFPTIPCTYYGEEGPYESPCSGYDFETIALHFGGDAQGWSKVSIPTPPSRGPVAFRQVTGVASNDVWIGAVYNSFCTDDCEGSQYGGAVFRGRADGAGEWQWAEEQFYGGQFRGGFAGSQVDAIGATGPNAVFLTGQSGADDFYEQFARGTDGVTFPSVAKGTFGTGSSRRSFYDWGVWANFAVWGSGVADVYVAGVNGRFRHWDGTAWAVVGIATDGYPILDDLHGIWADTKDIWVVGDNGVAIRKRVQPQE